MKNNNIKIYIQRLLVGLVKYKFIPMIMIVNQRKKQIDNLETS